MKEDEKMQEVYEFLKECEVYYLATIDGKNPRVRPFGTIDIFEDKLYIQTGKSKDVFNQIKKNPHVEICALNSSKDRWLRISATVVPDDRYEAKKHLLENYPNLKDKYSPDDDNTIVLYLQDSTAIFSSFTEKDKVIKF